MFLESALNFWLFKPSLNQIWECSFWPNFSDLSNGFLAKLDETNICQLHSQIWFRVGLNDQKFSADSKNICINVLYDIWCHYMTSHDILWHQMSFDDITWHLMSGMILIYMFLESAQNFWSFKPILDQILEQSWTNIFVSIILTIFKSFVQRSLSRGRVWIKI